MLECDIKKQFSSGLGHCLYDPPTEHNFEMPDILPGVMYGGDFQCKTLFGPNSGLCETGIVSSSVKIKSVALLLFYVLFFIGRIVRI